MRFALLGTGFVADYYMTTLANFPEHAIVGVFDSDAVRLQEFTQFHNLKTFTSYDDLLAHDGVEAVLVLTWPQNHAELAMRAFEAGKHVYCEKPMAMTLADATALTKCAQEAGLTLVSAPANIYSDAFQLTKETLQSGDIGAPRLVYAEMEDGAVFREEWREWRSLSGARWPGEHEFEIGCTFEHSGYVLGWLIGLFGEIKAISGTSAVAFPDKGLRVDASKLGVDFTTAILRFQGDVIVRLTCGLCAPKDRSLTIMGEDGTLMVRDIWDDRSDILLENTQSASRILPRFMRRFERWRGRVLMQKPTSGATLKYETRKSKKALPAFPSKIDFWAGPDALSKAVSADVEEQSKMRNYALHITEAQIALNDLPQEGGTYTMTTSL